MQARKARHVTGGEVWLSVVIPAYNEEAGISTTIEALDRYLRGAGFSYEIVVVDDGSTDETVRRVEEGSEQGWPVWLVRIGRNRGKGHAVRQGMLAARGRYRFFMDADLAYPVVQMGGMLTHLQSGYDLVIGSRMLPGSRMDARPPLRRHLAGRIYGFFIQLVLMRGIADTQCGFKGFTGEAAQDLFARLTLDGFAFDVELLFIARKRGYRIKLVPVHLATTRSASKVRLLSDSVRMFLDLFRIRRNDLVGRYKTTREGPFTRDDASKADHSPVG